MKNMKTKNSIFKSIIAITFAVFIIAGCKKKEEPAPTPTPPIVSPTDSTSQTTRATDQSNVENESNQAMDEANSALGSVSTTRDSQTECAFTIDSTYKNIGKITLNYNGVACSGKIRTGSITIQLPYNGTTITTWSTIGATATLTFTNYKVVYTNNNKSLKLNGSHTVTNVSGGGWIQLAMGNNLVHKVRSNMQISFDNATPIQWNSAKLRTLTYTGVFPNGILKAKMAGDTIMYVGSTCYTKVAMWGINSMGDHFTISVPIDFTYDIINPVTNCIYKPLTGEIVYSGITYEITLNYGVDQAGVNVIPGVCPWGYKIIWDNGQNDVSAIIPYPY